MKISLLLLPILFLSCGKQDAANPTGRSVDIEETAQQIGDLTASIDEIGGSGGTFAAREPSILRDVPSYLEKLLPRAYAASCTSFSGFSSCSFSSITRTFNGCTVGNAAFNGTVSFQWSGADCWLSIGGSVTRSPNFTVTGRRGATLSVQKVGTEGQKLTRLTDSGGLRRFEFTSDGIRRTFTLPSGRVLFQHKTETFSPIQITGHTRANRTMTGGTLRVTQELSGVTCDYTPSNVQWTSVFCNCPVSGTWTGNCSNGVSTSLTFQSCGRGSFTLGSESQTVVFDRCGS